MHAENQSFREMMELFEDQTFIRRFRRMLVGFKAPKGSGANKFARTELQRLLAPVAALVVPVVVAITLALVAVDGGPAERTFSTEIIEPDTIQELDRLDDILEPPPEFDPIDVSVMAEVSFDAPTPSPDAAVSPRPADFNAVTMVRSPIILRGIYGARTGAARGRALAGRGGSRETEAAVLRALRWLKHNQRPDGSWGRHRTAMTALGVLSFLAHGELPESPEFGDTVQRAIQFLIEALQPNGVFRHRDGHDYTHPMAAYALAEAYGMTQNPNVRAAAELAVQRVVRGQQANGGWNYGLNPAPNEDGSFRSDSSYMGWCAQSLAAARMAGLRVEGLEEAIRMGVRGFQTLAHPDGGFGYTSRGRRGLSGIGVLSMQLLGASRTDEVRKTLAFLEPATYSFDNWDRQPYGGRSPVYYWYYITQAKFHEGGRTWNAWNRMFSPELVKQMNIIMPEVSGYVDHEGNPQEIGYWVSPSESEHRGGDNESHVQDTTLSALQLMVYYRYLPTFQTPDVIEDFTTAEDKEDIVVDVVL